MTTTIPRTEPTHSYTPRGAALDLFARRDAEVLICGPAGTGKSRAALEKLNAMALENPGMRGLMLRKTAVSFTSSGLVTWKRDVIPELLEAGVVEYYGGSREEPAQYRYTNGSVVVLGGMDKASKIMSSEFDVVFVQEATELTLDDWEALTTRLRNGVVSFQQLIADCNPAEDTHWLKKRCDADKTAMLYSRHEDNPLLFTDTGDVTVGGAAYIAKLDALTGVRFLRLRKGEWSSAEGVVYEEWDSAVHLIDWDQFEALTGFDAVPDDWTRYWVLDFGFTHPFVCQHWAEDPDGRLYLYREWYRTQMLVSEHAEQLMGIVTDTDEKGKLVWVEPKPRAVVCDHDAEGRATFQKSTGLATIPAKKTVEDGIQAVKSRLKLAGDGRPRLYVLRDALIRRDPDLVEAAKPTCTAEEVGGYIWDTARSGVTKEVPVKEDDHGMDCVRYMTMYREKRGWKLPSIRYLE